MRSGDDDDRQFRRGRTLAESFENVEPGQPGQRQIENDRVEQPGLELLEGMDAGDGRFDGEPGTLENRFDEPADAEFVLDDQNVALTIGCDIRV